MIAAWTRQHDKHEAMRILGDAGVPAGAVFDTMELTDDPDFERRGIMQTMQHPVAGPFKMPGWPVRFGGRTPKVEPAPLLGQHTNEVLGEWLGLDAGRDRATRQGQRHLGKETGHGGTHRLGDPRQIAEERRHRHSVLPHGRADAARRVLLHQGRHPPARRAPRASGRLHGPGL